MNPSNVHHLVPGFRPAVLCAMFAHAYADPGNEVGGIFVGVKREGRFEVTGSVAARRAEGDRTSLTFTHAAWAEMLAEMDDRHPGTQIVGWYHSHPGHGIFLSAHDRFIHENFFAAAWHVALVIDPQRHIEGLFAWVGGALESVASTAIGPELLRTAAHAPPASAAALLPPPPSVRGRLLVGITGDQPRVEHVKREEPRRGRDGIRAIALGLALPVAAGLLAGVFVGLAV